jgi:hypothetical protein
MCVRPRSRLTFRLPLIVAVVLILSSQAQGTPPWDYVFAVTTDFGPSGTFSIADVVPPWSVDVNLGSIHGDAVARHHGGLIYIVNRLYADNIQVLDPQQNFATVIQFSVGPGSNPQDIAVVSPDRAYVSRYETAWLYEVDPTAGAVLDSIDLSGFADTDGLPEMGQMALVGDLLFVSIQRLDRDNFWLPVAPSYLAVIDTNTNALVDADPVAPGIQGIELTGLNPATEIQVDEEEGIIYVGESGQWNVSDGGVDAVDAVGLTALGFVATEGQLGGDLDDFTLPVNGRAHAIVSVSTPGWEAYCVSFDWTDGDLIDEVWRPGGFSVEDIEVHPGTGQLFLCDRTYTDPGVRVFNVADGSQLTAGPLSVGLPPFDLVIVGDTVTGVGDTPAELGLTLQIASNPGAAGTLIVFTLPSEGSVRLDIYDVSGRHVRELERGPLGEGEHVVSWDGLDSRGRPAASGVYFVKAEAGGASATGKVVLLR